MNLGQAVAGGIFCWRKSSSRFKQGEPLTAGACDGRPGVTVPATRSLHRIQPRARTGRICNHWYPHLHRLFPRNERDGVRRRDWQRPHSGDRFLRPCFYRLKDLSLKRSPKVGRCRWSAAPIVIWGLCNHIKPGPPFRQVLSTTGTPGLIVTHSAVTGSMTVLTADTRLAGNPPSFACSRTTASFGAI